MFGSLNRNDERDIETAPYHASNQWKYLADTCDQYDDHYDEYADGSDDYSNGSNEYDNGSDVRDDVAFDFVHNAQNAACMTKACPQTLNEECYAHQEDQSEVGEVMEEIKEVIDADSEVESGEEDSGAENGEETAQILHLMSALLAL